MNTELATVDGEVIDQRAPMTLFGTDDPQAVVVRASTVATALAGVINERHLYSQIANKKHVQVEGWTLLGSMLGVFAEVEWSRPLDNGWEARAVARTLAGQVVGAAEAMCTANEGRWRAADSYAVRSMAQTRAVSKALRLPLGFIMQLAGYSATPAEELNDEPGQGAQSERQAPRGSSEAQSAAPAPADKRAILAQLAGEKHLDHAALETYAGLVGIKPGTRATDSQLDALIAAVQGHGTDAPLDLPFEQEPFEQEPFDEPEADAVAPSAPASSTVEEANAKAQKRAKAVAA
jgi:hypothetical protein